jgi:hypothetical protein
MNLESISSRLADVTGVVGSFVSDSDGELLFASMPQGFGEPELRRTTSRLASIVSCATRSGLDVERCDINVGPCRLLVSRFRGGTLCVLVESVASRRVVRMAMQQALEELPPLVIAMGVDAESGEEDEATTRYLRQEHAPASA